MDFCTVCHVGLALHSAVACCAAVDASCVLKAGEIAVGQVFECSICVQAMTQGTSERLA